MTWLPDGQMGPYLGLRCFSGCSRFMCFVGGVGGLGTAPEFEHPVEER